MLIGAGVVLLALFGGGAALCVACRRFTGLKRKSADQTETQKRLESDDKCSTKRSNGGTTLLFQSARPVAAVSRTCGIGSFGRLARAASLTLYRFTGSLRPCVLAPLRFPRAPLQRKDARVQRRKGGFFTAARVSGVADRTSITEPGVVGIYAPQMCSAFLNRRQQRERRKT